MKRKIKKIVIIVLLSILLIFIARSCVLSIARIGTLIPRDNTTFWKNIDSFSYMVDMANGIYDSESTDVVVTKIRIDFFAYAETIDVDIYGESYKEIKTYDMKMTPEIFKHYERIRKVFEKWNKEFDGIVVCGGQVNFYANEMPYALIYRENGWYPSSLVPGKDIEDFYTERISIRWFHSWIK